MAEETLRDDTESQALRRTKRTIIVPDRAKQEVAERTAKRTQYERHVNKQKRKAFAEARDAADDDDESSDDGGSPKRARKAGRFNDSLLMQPYDRVTNDGDRHEWLLAAIYRRDGDDLRNSSLTREELEELWEKQDDGAEDQVDHYAGITIDRVEHRVADGRGATSQPRKLKPTDSTTIGLGDPMVYRAPRDHNGKLVPIEGGAAVGTGTRSGGGDNGNNRFKPGGGSMASKKPANSSATSSQVNGYADGFRVTPVPQPKRRDEFRAPVPQSALRLSTQSSSQPTRDHLHSSSQPNRDRERSLSQPARSLSQPARDRMRSLSQPTPQNTPPRRQSNGSPLVPPRRRDPPSTPVGRHASVPGSARQARASPVVPSPARSHPGTRAGPPHARASSTPNRSTRSSRPPVPHAPSPVPRRAPGPFNIRPAASRGGDTDLDEEPENVFGQEDSGEFGQEEVGENEQFFLDDGGDDGGDDGSDQPQLTKRQLAQLSRFGIAKPLVQELARRIKLRAVTECAYADVLPCLSEPDGNGNRHDLGTILEVWLPEVWADVNREMRPGQLPLPLLEAYCTYVKDDFSGVRNHVKNMLQVLVPSEFGFISGFSEENEATAKKLLPDGFLSPTFKQPDPEDQFRSKIISTGIKACWFNTRQAVGFKHAAKFRPMPLPTIAFICTIIHFLISDFSSGEQQLAKLDADRQSPWFERFLDALEDMGKPQNCPRRLVNVQREIFDKCHGKFQPASHPKIQRAVIEYGSDSEEEYTYVS